MLLLVAAGGIWWAEQDQQRSQQAEQQARKLTRVTADQVQQMRYWDAEGESLLLRREAQGWQITEPHRWMTDQGAAERLLQPLQAHWSKAVTPRGADGAPFGLQKGQGSRLHYRDEGGELLFSLQRGDSAMSRGTQYAALADGSIVLMSQSDLNPLSQKVAQLRDRNPIPGWDRQRIQQLHLSAQGRPQLSLMRQAEGWQLRSAQQQQMPASRQRVARWLDQLLLQRGDLFLEQEAMPQGEADWQVQLADAGGKRRVIPIWREGEDVVLTRQGEAGGLRFKQQLGPLLEQNPMELVALKPIEGAELQMLAYRLAASELWVEAQRDQKGWPKPFWQTFEQLLTREARTAKPVAAVARVANVASLQLKARLGKKVSRFELWPQDKSWYLHVEGAHYLLQLTPLQIEQLEELLSLLGREGKR
uniref:DUF4340 domain-containing protein n=1 Tax=Magnetococcus massalia (strain MO-1) TaxID=451514 RepID=A0A1S7LFF5_MAGMO|nr:Conserved protein of unknown function [Candidatus Magnetococcus massalia]